MNKTLLVITISLFAMLLLTTIFVLHKSNSGFKKVEPKAKVLTSWGCLQTDDSIKDFDNRQNLFKDKLGFSLTRCD